MSLRLDAAAIAARIYDGPTEAHKWSLAEKIKRGWTAGQGA